MRLALILAVLALGINGALAQSAVPANGYPPPLLTTGNQSATITVGNTFQTVLAAAATKTARRSLTIQNNMTTADGCWVDFGVRANGTVITAGNATKGESIYLGPGGSYVRSFPYVPSDEIEATCANANDTLHIDIQ